MRINVLLIELKDIIIIPQYVIKLCKARLQLIHCT